MYEVFGDAIRFETADETVTVRYADDGEMVESGGYCTVGEIVVDFADSFGTVTNSLDEVLAAIELGIPTTYPVEFAWLTRVNGAVELLKGLASVNP